VWEMPNIFLNAEHHAVAEVGDGMIDVSPPLFGERRVLFLPSNENADIEELDLTPNGTVRNRYFALSEDDQTQLIVRTFRQRENAKYSTAEWKRLDGIVNDAITKLKRRVAIRSSNETRKRKRDAAKKKRKARRKGNRK